MITTEILLLTLLVGPVLRGSELAVGDVSVSALGDAFSVPVVLTSDEPVAGLTVVLDYEPAVFTVDAVTFEGNPSPAPEWTNFAVHDTWVAFGWLMDFSPPYDGPTVPADAAHEVGRIACTLVPGTAPQSVALHLPPEGRTLGTDPHDALLKNSYATADGRDDYYPTLIDGTLTVTWPPVTIDAVQTASAGTVLNLTVIGQGFIPQSEVTIDGEPAAFTLIDAGTIAIDGYDCAGAAGATVRVCNGELCDEASFACGTPFSRADPNMDGKLDIADPVLILGYLFSGVEMTCLDAGDSNDDGALNIADAIHALGYLFSSGPAPPPPFPGLGLDPTPDALDCQSYGL